MKTVALMAAIALLLTSSCAEAQSNIQHDAEHYVLVHQYAEQWAAEDKEIDSRLAEIRARNGGKAPNIVYILIDDMGFGEFGMPELHRIRGGRMPSLDEFAQQGMTFTRFYAENICTSTRAAFITGRYAVRTGMELTKVTPPEGVGIRDEEVTLAELLSAAGYATHHIGKWHMGDIKAAYPTNQGFDYASFPMHNQVAYSFLTRDAEIYSRTTSFTPTTIDPDYGLDKTFRLYDWVTQVEGRKGGKVREWGIEPGQRPDIEFYQRVNERFQEQALESLRELAKGDKPFFLNYWPQIPVAVLNSTDDSVCQTPNCGRWANAHDLQLTNSALEQFTRSVINTNLDAEMYGVEVEARWRPAFAPRAELELGYGWLSAEAKNEPPRVDPLWLTAGDPELVELHSWATTGDRYVVAGSSPAGGAIFVRSKTVRHSLPSWNPVHSQASR